MIIQKITEENMARYQEMIPQELQNDLNREYFRGLCGEKESTGEPEAVIIWELRSVEDETEPTSAEIRWFQTASLEGGDGLLEAFGLELKEENARRACFELKEEDLKLMEKACLLKAGFSLEKGEGRDICVTVKELSQLKLSRTDKAVPDYIKSLSDITVREFKVGIMACVFRARYGLLDDLTFLEAGYFDPGLSSCIITDGKVNGFLLVHKAADGTYIVELLFAMPPDANINLLHMIRHSIRAASGSCKGEQRVILRRHNEAAEALIRKLFPDKKGDQVMKGEKQYGYE